MAKYICRYNDQYCNGRVNFGVPCAICGIRVGLCKEDDTEYRKGEYWDQIEDMHNNREDYVCSNKCLNIYKMIPQKRSLDGNVRTKRRKKASKKNT